MMRNFIICIHQILLRRKIKEGEMGRTRSKHGRDEKFIQKCTGKPEGKRSLGRPKRRWIDR